MGGHGAELPPLALDDREPLHGWPGHRSTLSTGGKVVAWVLPGLPRDPRGLYGEPPARQLRRVVRAPWAHVARHVALRWRRAASRSRNDRPAPRPSGAGDEE